MHKRKNHLLPGEIEDKYEGADFKYLKDPQGNKHIKYIKKLIPQKIIQKIKFK